MNGIPEPVSAPVVLETLQSLLRAQGEITLPATGFSMGPVFRSADGLVIGAVGSGAPLPPGTGVVFVRHGRWVAHRLWMKGGMWCVTGGDATWTLDWPPPRRSEIEGRVVALIRVGRRVGLDGDTVSWRAPIWWGRGLGRLIGRGLSRILRICLEKWRRRSTLNVNPTGSPRSSDVP